MRGVDSLLWKRKHFAWITLLKGSNTESLVIKSYNFGLKILDSFGFFFYSFEFFYDFLVWSEVLFMES